MSRSIPGGAAVIALGALAAAVLGPAVFTPAAAAPLAGAAVRTVSGSDVVVVRYHRRHYRRGYYAGRVVEAPFTRVETWGGGRVAVDAPFAAVRVGRRGTWVRAPFVDIYVPR